MEDEISKVDQSSPKAIVEHNSEDFTKDQKALESDPDSALGSTTLEESVSESASGILDTVKEENQEAIKQQVNSDLPDDDFKLHRDENADKDNRSKSEAKGANSEPETSKSETQLRLDLLISEATDAKSENDFEIAVIDYLSTKSHTQASESNKDYDINVTSEDKDKTVNNEDQLAQDVNEANVTDTTLSSELDSSIYPEKQHGLIQPDQMIEIPTQEFIDIDDSVIDDFPDDEVAKDNNDLSTKAIDNILESLSVEDTKDSTLEVQGGTDTSENIVSDEALLNVVIENTANNIVVQDPDSSVTIGDPNIVVDNSESIMTENTDFAEAPMEIKIANVVNFESGCPEITEINTEPNKEQDEIKLIDTSDGTSIITTVDKEQTVAPVIDQQTDPAAESEHLETIIVKVGQPIAISPSTVESERLEAINHVIDQPIAISSTTVESEQLEVITVEVDHPVATSSLTVESELVEAINAVVDQPIAISSTVESESLEAKTVEVDQPIATSSSVANAPLATKQSTVTFELPDQDSDEVTEMEDSLGLLAESSRVMDDEDDEDDGDGDADEDEDDYEPDDDSSNLMTAEHSEDSNNHQSENDQPVITDDLMKETPSPTDGKKFSFPGDECEEKDEVMDVIECEEMEIPSPTSDLDAEKVETIEDITVQDTLEKDDKQEDQTVQIVGQTESKDKTNDKETTIDNNAMPSLDAPTPSLKVQTSPSKTKVLNISNQTHVVNYVDLEESSSEDDIQLIKQKSDTDTSNGDVTAVNLPKDIDVMCASAGTTSEIVTKDDELVINVPKTLTPKSVPKLNTGELTIKTVSTSESSLVIPEAKVSDVIEPSQSQKKNTSLSLEIFSLDSDDEDTKEPAVNPAPRPTRPRYKCGNPQCRARVVSPSLPSAAGVHYFRLDRKKRPRLCEDCQLLVTRRQYNMVEGIKSFMPLMDLDMEIANQELVEISDSESDEEGETNVADKEVVGEDAAELLNEHLADVLNETWTRYELDSRLKDTETEILADLEKLEKEGAEINAMFDECQMMTDKLRNDLYATFEPIRKERRGIVIVDIPGESMAIFNEGAAKQYSKRRLSSSTEPPNKRPAVPLGHTDKNAVKSVDAKDDDSQEDVSVVRLCAELAPETLPPPGELLRPPLRVGMPVYAMRNAFGSWSKAKILDILGKAPPPNQQFTQCRVRFENKVKNPCKVILARCLAYTEPSNVRLTIGTRVVALFKYEESSNREAFYSGVVAEVPNPVNNYRYLVFFDDGYAQYVSHAATRLVAQCARAAWDEVHPLSREFVYNYLRQYPERPMVRLHAGQRLKVELNGKWYESPVIQVDASLVQVHFEEENRREWIYRGSTRLEPLFLELQAAERTRHRALPRAKGQNLVNVPYVEYTRSDEQNKSAERQREQQQKEQEEIRRQRAVAKKSTSTQQVPIAINTTVNSVNASTITSRVVYYTPKNAVKPFKMVAHNCGPRCKRSDVLSLKDLRTYNPLAKPLLSGWERQIVRARGPKEVMYRAPCGRRLRNMSELHRYLRLTRSDLSVDLFDFAPATHCLAEFVLNKCLVGKKDLSHGRENVPVPCVNYYDTSLPEFCSYSTERTPTDGVPLNLDPEFLCGCDCTDDCQDKTKCACWKMTLEGARTIGLGPDVGYVYRRLPEPLPSGIYECNSRCKCKNTCLNRVVQHPLQLKLQVFKTLNRGWGIRSLNDVPKGSFLCIYAGNLLTDATANLDGLNEGDEYLAELDYIEVVEQMKEGYEEDVAEDTHGSNNEAAKESSSDSQEEMTSSEEEKNSNDKDDDDDFRPNIYETILLGDGVRERSSRRKRQVKEDKEKKRQKEKEKTENKGEEDCITISDDEEVREPSRFAAQAGMDQKGSKPKYRSVRAHFGKDEACYIMDAKVQGNIGRYLNHSCSPNVFVQNVFVDSQDPRFPWVAFFALTAVRAGAELTWNYNYDVGSVPGKLLYCYCGAPNCRGRLL